MRKLFVQPVLNAPESGMIGFLQLFGVIPWEE